MVLSDEENIRFREQQANIAVSLAMEGKWQEAVAANHALLERLPFDVEAHNRLGRALVELGEYAGARESYSRALELAPHNAIARKNLERLSHLGSRQQTRKKGKRHKFAPDIFVRESGKAAVVALEQLASAEVLARVTAGEEVVLTIAGGRLLVENEKGEYLGRIEPKYERRLVRLMEGGNKYAAAVNSVDKSKMKVIVKEIYQHPSLAGHHSFVPEAPKGFQPAARKGMLKYDLDEEVYGLDGEEFTEDRGETMEDLGFHEVSTGG